VREATTETMKKTKLKSRVPHTPFLRVGPLHLSFLARHELPNILERIRARGTLSQR
jgi:hypothetical protein